MYSTDNAYSLVDRRLSLPIADDLTTKYRSVEGYSNDTPVKGLYKYVGSDRNFTEPNTRGSHSPSLCRPDKSDTKCDCEESICKLEFMLNVSEENVKLLLHEVDIVTEQLAQSAEWMENCEGLLIYSISLLLYLHLLIQ